MENVNLDLILRTSECVKLMDEEIRNRYSDSGETVNKKLWENTYICHQIGKRREGKKNFCIKDHIRGMVYSFISSGVSWNRYEKDINVCTGEIESIDKIFNNYDPEWLLNRTSEGLVDDLRANHFLTPYSNKQMKALIENNVPKLMDLDKCQGGIDGAYQKYLKEKNEDSSLLGLVKALADKNEKYKMAQMGEALAAEYLRNVGYDLPKPDRHIRRILGIGILACSEKKNASVREVFDVIPKIANKLEKNNAEIDYILWSYCANGFGEICTKKNPKCEICTVKKYCQFGNYK